MKKKKCVFLCLSFFFISINLTAQQILIKISNPEIQGESTFKGHENEIVALRYAQEATACDINKTTGAGGLACKVTTSSFAFDIQINKAIPPLKMALYSNTHLAKVEITFRKPGSIPFTYYKIVLGDVVVTKMTDATDGTSNTCQVQFSALKYFWVYYPQTDNGSAGTPVTFGWNSQTNASWDGN